ncbi:MAG: hypothetical protein Fur0017_30070 [Anaerolineales bacterium]
MESLRQIGHDGGMDKFIRDLKPLINIPPAERDRPLNNYVVEANQLRGWALE